MPEHEHTDDVGDEGKGDREHTDDGEAGDGKDDTLDDYHDDGHESWLITIMMMGMMIKVMLKMIMMMVSCLPMKCFTKRQVRRLHLAGWEKNVS